MTSTRRQRRVLIVSPHFPPVNAPDMQRVRMALPFLRGLGWEPVVLALAPECIEAASIDPLLEASYPADVEVHRVRGLPPSLTRPLGFGNLWWRCGRTLTRAGDALVAEGRFDLAFFSTTLFDSFLLGPRWLHRHGLPYALDYQDPWQNPHYRERGLRPPGGRFRFGLSQFLARRKEPVALRHAAGVLAVSTAYGPLLSRLYPGFDGSRVRVLPFGSLEADLDIARSLNPGGLPFDPSDGLVHLVSVGRCGPPMESSLRILLSGLRGLLDAAPAEARRIRIHFMGTDYAPAGLSRESALPLARGLGVADLVTESCARLPFYEALHCLCAAQGVLAVGSDDPGYVSSRLVPCLQSGRPLLALYHADSPVLAMLAGVNPEARVGFRPAPRGEEPDPAAVAACRDWLARTDWRKPACHDEQGLRKLGAETAATSLADWFNSLVCPEDTKAA